MATLGDAPSLSQGGGGSAVGGSAAAVPEPGTFALLLAAALGLIGRAAMAKGVGGAVLRTCPHKRGHGAQMLH